MKCDCRTCKGTGQTVCIDCDGTGCDETRIEIALIPKGHKHFNELMALKSDANKVIRDSIELIKRKPDFRESYRRQRISALDEINRQAEKLISK